MKHQHIPELDDGELAERLLQISKRNEENDDMLTEQQAINGSKLSRRQWIAIGGLVLAFVAALCASLAFAQTPRTATITFTAPTTRTDGTSITGALSYEVWQGLKGGTKTKVSTITSSATTISTGLQGGKEYCWHVVAVEASGGSSVPSNEACKAFDLSAPNTVTITVT